MTVADLKVLVNNLDEYIHIPGGVERLKKTVLHLAVSGQLAPQDPNEGTGEDLLLQIQAIIKLKKQLPIIQNTPFDIPKNWKWVRLGNVGNIGTGATPARDNASFYGGNIPWVTSTLTSQEIIWETPEHITDKAIKMTNCSIYPVGSIVIAMYGQGKTRGQVSKLGIAAATNQACAVFEINDYINIDFILNNLKYNYESMRQEAAGGAQPNLNVQKIKEILIPLPPVKEQHRIVAKIDEIFELINELANKYRAEEVERSKYVRSSLRALSHNSSSQALDNLSQTIKTKADVSELRKAILHLAVSGKLIQQDVADGTGSDLYEQIQNVISQDKKHRKASAINDEDLPFKIPKNWVWVRLGDIHSKITDGSHNPPAGDPSGLPMISSRNVNRNTISFDNVRFLSESKFLKENAHTQVAAGDVLLTIVGSIGRTAIVYDRHLPLTMQRSVAVLTPVIADNKYLAQVVFPSDYMQEALENEATGTAQKGVYLNQVRELLIPLPPLSEQKRIVQKATELLDLVDEVEKTII